MLNPEKAKEQLQALRVEDWKIQCVDKIANLPNSLRSIAWGILGYDDLGEATNRQNYYTFQTTACKQLNSLDSVERLQIFSLIFPQFYSTVENAWQLFNRLPYQLGYQRKAFRISHPSEITFESRFQWLRQLLQVVKGYEQNLSWWAAWTPYVGYYGGDTLGILFAAAIEADNEEGKEIFDILIASGKSEHEIGAMGRHVTRALLIASRPDGWELIEKLLLAAQRQEGLRQTILETIDEAHPEAFRRMVRLIIDHDLTRFSATIRAVDVWLGLGWDTINHKVVKGILEQIWQYLEVQGNQTEALKSDDPQTVYIALWTLGFQDAIASIPSATEFLYHPQAEIRFVAVYFLTQVGLTEAKLAVFPALKDENLRVSTAALMTIYAGNNEKINQTNLFEILEEIIESFPKKTEELSPLVWEWMKTKVSQQTVAKALFNNLGERSPKRLIPYISLLDPYTRARVAEKLSQVKPWDTEIREALFSLIADASSWVRERVIKIIKDYAITPEEAVYLESLLTRKSGDLRRGILQILLNQPDQATLASTQRLLSSNKVLQRQAGLELLREMGQQNRCHEQCLNYANEYQSNRPQLIETEIQLLNTILAVDHQEPTLEDALGLINLSELTPPIPPQIQNPPLLITSAAKACLISLDELIHEHRQTPVVVENRQGEKEELLGNLAWGFAYPDAKLSVEKDQERFPLRDIWETWWQNRPDRLRDQDNLEFLRTIAALSNRTLSEYSQLKDRPWWKEAQKTLFIELPLLKYPHLIKSILIWLIRLHPTTNTLEFLLDACAKTLTLIPFEEITTQPNFNISHWEIRDSILVWLEVTRLLRPFLASFWNNSHQIRFWQLIHWLDQYSLDDWSYSFNKCLEIVATYHGGGVTKADVIDYLLAAKPPKSPEQSSRRSFRDLSTITTRKASQDLDPILKEIAPIARQRILEIELKRGDLPTAASQPALALQSVEGIDIIVQLLQVLGKDKLIRGYTYDNLSKAAVFSHLIRVSFPSDSETPQDFAHQVQGAKIPQERLIELAFYAPQWSNYVEKALGWKNFSEAIWWIHAHTKDNSWHVSQEIRETWIAQISERTPLSAQNLIDGAVDVAWYNRIYQALKGIKWEQITEAAKYASGGSGHKRSQLFAEAMSGQIKSEQLMTSIIQKRHQDSVRALGLLPLPKGNKRDKDLLNRYQTIQEFLRTSRKFGSQRQASEKLAATIGLENLARTAGYPDPQRLEWEMETQVVADLAIKPQTVTIEDISVSLAITEAGEPQITVSKQGKPLKSIPAKIGKNLQIVELKNRKQEITRQASRMNTSLEDAMNRGDNFSPKELQNLCQHPVLSSMLKQLILIGEDIIGYPIEKGKALRFHNGTIHSIESGSFRIAHPHDLLATGDWHLWQQDCFDQKRQQPFKQVFRELYLLTAAEKASETLSRRYEGHQINPRQALALFGKRGWVTCPEEGVRKTFHEAGISVWVSFLEGFYTPTEVEGLTLEGIYFSQRGEWKPLKLEEIPSRLFSEVMRDLDLVVSVAHQGGVDPEASASTVEMRTVLVQETCRLLKLSNVKLQHSHALIEGTLGSYSVHLGSAMVHRQPGGALCIVPVHSQHRGRIFLPFVDDDPKTAEVVSKVLLLARDQEIQDPTILQQILP